MSKRSASQNTIENPESQNVNNNIQNIQNSMEVESDALMYILD